MTEKRLSVREEQDEFIRDFNELDDWMFQYDCLLTLGSELAPVSDEEKNADTLILGCQARLWLVLSCDREKGRIFIKADSEALIVKGITAVIVALLDDRTPEEILEAEIDFIEKTSLKEQISTDRSAGMKEVVQKIKDFASCCQRHAMQK